MKQTISLGTFDAEFSTDPCDDRNNAELTVKLKLGFRQVNPSGGAATGTYHDYGDATEANRQIIAWDATAWNAWINTFVRSAEQYWNGKFWLVNHRGIVPQDVAGTIYIPNVYCKFDIIGRDASIGVHHHVIEVVRLAASETFFGSHSTLYDSLDTNSVRKGVDNHGNAIMQRAHVHEVGHLLGLEHVDVGQSHCPATSDTNASQCYGVSDSSLYDVMGRGMTLHSRHAAPWLRAMDRFRRVIPASPLYAPPAALVSRFRVAMRRHYPRTIAEYEAGAEVTAR